MENKPATEQTVENKPATGQTDLKCVAAIGEIGETCGNIAESMVFIMSELNECNDLVGEMLDDMESRMTESEKLEYALMIQERKERKKKSLNAVP